ncbi:M14 family metallopeptidase [Derxia lacustris]|uniref:M14 family metallopeptidase n=1 Tax=Derxia lacustris TaxID=764842 RepID=UPI000A174977|nr:M14-type cytosolic carboxypeptidase [Derxia lacustris]
MRISDNFDSGSIELVKIDGNRIDLDIPVDSTFDPLCDFRQWFHFRLATTPGEPVQLRFLNARQCTYPDGWRDYRLCASYDRETWFRIDTRYDDVLLEADFTPEHGVVWFAYFEPYSWERHQRQLGKWLGIDGVRHLDLGRTVDGRDMDGIEFGNPDGAPVWIIARQHPGEAMAEWFVEGMVDRLLDPADSLARSLLAKAHFFVVPNMNPDGAVRGNLRANAAGANLNREWMEPSERAPEVAAVREKLLETGCEFFLDVHGDEGLPYVFVAGSEMLPGFTEAQAKAQAAFCAAFKAAAPDFQTEHGYPSGKYSEEALKLASKWVGYEFGCLSLTLEMPFKDNADLPDEKRGWDGARSKALGAALLPALAVVLG